MSIDKRSLKLICKNIIYFLFFIFVVGCIGRVQWIQRKGGKPEEKNWIPVCPSCKQVVNHEALQCVNPKCKALLTWKDKVTYAKKLYHEEEQEKEGIPAPSSLIEETKKDSFIEKETQQEPKAKIVESKEEEKKAPQEEPQKKDETKSSEKKQDSEKKDDSKEWEFDEEDWK